MSKESSLWELLTIILSAFLLYCKIYLAGSIIASVVKTSLHDCDRRYGIERLSIDTDWFCPVDEVR